MTHHGSYLTKNSSRSTRAIDLCSLYNWYVSLKPLSRALTVKNVFFRLMDSLMFPRELQYAVINAIDISSSDGQHSLVNCSYANRALSVICQQRIFEYVEISYVAFDAEDIGVILHDDERTTGHKFLNLLAGSPHIGPYVRNLTMRTLPHRGRPKSAKYSTESSNTPFFSLYAIMPQLHNLKGFITSPADLYPWHSFEGRTKNFSLVSSHV
ncbi:hypothetical protein CPB84DRAFT_558463 [Gymnopilus junonius]|uniref:Uncharacterized protein n=1 Tax=Gymnopilus junonius TaxID=109634 RepID=A0A9P5N9A2_GYMJU|nr:hypothetical protein CPB84DRAFT_558463 [Gymnopilus junonius]